MFQVPKAVIRPASKAQFHRSAEAMLRTMAEDLGQTQVSIAIDSNATRMSSMGSVTMTTPSQSLEVYMDAIGPREATRLIYRDRFGNEKARSKWLSDLALDVSSRSGLIQELRILARNACHGAAVASQSKGGSVRKFTASLRPEPLPEPRAAMLRGALLCRASVCAGVRHLERIRSIPPLPQLRKPTP